MSAKSGDYPTAHIHQKKRQLFCSVQLKPILQGYLKRCERSFIFCLTGALEVNLIFLGEALEKKGAAIKFCLNAYTYGFNGKEKDQNGEWGSVTNYDYGFRIYNPGIGKFLSVDPLTASYPWYTPYQFAGNTPIQAIDLDGLEEYFVIWDQHERAKEQMTTEELNRINQIEFYTVMGLSSGPILAEAAAVSGLYSLFLRGIAFAYTNPVSFNYASMTAVGFLAGVAGYDGVEFDGYGDDFARLGKKGYQELTKRGIQNSDELGTIARKGYNKIVGTIDSEISELKTLEEKAHKAFDVRNKAKDFARELSGPDLKKAAENDSFKRFGSSEGPSFDDLFQKAKGNGLTDDQAYDEIIKSSKRTSAEKNKKYSE